MQRFTSILALVVLSLAAACSDAPTHSTVPTSDTTETIPELARTMLAEYGQPEAGELSTTLANLVNHEFEKYLADTSYDIYALTMVWGHLGRPAPGPGPNTTMDWSGTASTNAVGALGVISPILFEPREDSLIPDNDETSVAWSSTIHTHVDGLACFVALKRGVAYLVQPTLTITTAQITLTYDTDRLDSLKEYHSVSNTAGIAIHSWKIRHRGGCLHGVLRGAWVRDVGDDFSGNFAAVWSSMSPAAADPALSGRVAGRFWQQDGHNLFAGDWINHRDSVVGHIKGGWAYTDMMMCPTCGTRFGVFRGEIFDLDDNAVGQLKGEFGTMTNVPNDPNPRMLPLRGMFRFYCSPSPSDDANVQ